MKSREDIENIVQRITCKLLPKVPPEDIRPTYQQNDKAGRSIVTEDGTQQYIGYSAQDNFIYITVVLGSGSQAYVYDDGIVKTTARRTVTFTFYGSQSSQLSLCLYSLLRLPQAISAFEHYGLYLQSIDDEISEMRELINEEWFERHDFTIIFNEIVTVKVPQDIQQQNVFAEQAPITVIPDFKEVNNVGE